MGFKSATRMNEGSSLSLRVDKPSEDYGVIRPPDRQIMESSFGHIHSEEYKPMAQVMKRMVVIYKKNEWTLQKPFPAKRDSKLKLRFTP